MKDSMVQANHLFHFLEQFDSGNKASTTSQASSKQSVIAFAQKKEISTISLGYFPIIHTKQQLIDIVSRAAWFLAKSSLLEKIYIPISSENLKHVKWYMDPNMDASIAKNFANLREKVIFVLVRSTHDIDSYMSKVNVILRWKQDIIFDTFSEKQMLNWEKGKKVFFVDPLVTAQEGGNYIDVGFSAIKDKTQLIEANESKFKHLIQKLGKFKRSFLIATGPSVENYQNINFENALSIVCNSVILNKDLMQKVKPQILVFADPIFHFGPSQYSGTFRNELVQAMHEFDFTICMPLKYYPLFIANYPELEPRTIGIPFKKDGSWNFDLSQKFLLEATKNILTFLMIPIATTFADEISFLGCNGRPLDEDTYFWKHNTTTQINDKMSNIREVHPGFFNIDYNDYYLEHCETLKTQIEACEKNNKTFSSLGFSYIPALKEHTDYTPSCGLKEPVFFPRLLMIDSTPLGHVSATGQLKQTFLEEWTNECFLQVWQNGDVSGTLHLLEKNQNIGASKQQKIDMPALVKKCKAFHPEVIYFRPIDSDTLFDFVHLLHQALPRVPLVIHMMDDWPERLRENAPAQFKILDEKLRTLLAQADVRLSISDAMSKAYLKRYGHQFTPLSNGVDIHTFPAKNWPKRKPVNAETPFTIRYMGALADDMTYTSVSEVASVVSKLAAKYPIRFEIFTMDWCLKKAKQNLEIFRGVSVFNLVPIDEYPQLLASSDALLIAYNFDPKSISYIGLSLANKMPECLASGAPVIAYGPSNVATIAYLKQPNCCIVIDEHDLNLLSNQIELLILDIEKCALIGERARQFISQKHSKSLVKKAFLESHIKAIKNNNKTLLVGSFLRSQKMHLDETQIIAELFNRLFAGKTMIDVGAHFGTALVPFLDKGWDIFAFEPDEKNCQHLLQCLANHPYGNHVKLDTHAVSDKIQQGLSFYRSEESTGVSGLSAFLSSHTAEQTVNTITLTKALAYENIDAIDFLKIDTEGHDLFVLKGFPWDRFKPAVIECEFEDAKTIPLGYTFYDLADYLVEKGYTVYVSEWHPIIRYGIRHNWRQLSRYPCKLVDEKGWGNLLAFYKPISEDELTKVTYSLLKSGEPNVHFAKARKTEHITQKPHMQLQVQLQRLVPKIQFREISASKNFINISEMIWQYKTSMDNKDFWVAIFDIQGEVSNTSLLGSISLQTSQTVKLRISLGRYATTTPYEGFYKDIELAANSPIELQVEKTFSQNYEALKVQIEVLEGDSFDLKLNSVNLELAILSKVRQNISEEDINLVNANLLFRQRAYAKAMGIYLLLYMSRPLHIYIDNLAMCMRKLGLQSTKTLNDLLEHM